MNVLNSLVFTVLGASMEMLPRVFPSWFPHSGADSANARTVWMGLMGAVQIFLGLGFIVRIHLLPLMARVIAMAPAGEAGALALQNPRGATVR